MLIHFVSILGFFGLCLASPNREHTPLLNEMPCIAENLKVSQVQLSKILVSNLHPFFQETDHYICSDDHKMICLTGWSEPENACRTPVCDFVTAVDEDGERIASKSCSEHGECVRPDVCACEVGWEGAACDQCIPMPGCKEGHCNEAFECICDDPSQYKGAQCDIRKKEITMLASNKIIESFLFQQFARLVVKTDTAPTLESACKYTTCSILNLSEKVKFITVEV